VSFRDAAALERAKQLIQDRLVFLGCAG